MVCSVAVLMWDFKRIKSENWKYQKCSQKTDWSEVATAVHDMWFGITWRRTHAAVYTRGYLTLITHTRRRRFFMDGPRHRFYRHMDTTGPLWPFTPPMIHAVCVASGRLTKQASVYCSERGNSLSPQWCWQILQHGSSIRHYFEAKPKRSWKKVFKVFNPQPYCEEGKKSCKICFRDELLLWAPA